MIIKSKKYISNGNLTKKIKSFSTFIKNNVEVSHSKKSFFWGVGVTFALMITVIIFKDRYLSQEFASKWLVLAFSLMFPFAIGTAITFTIKITDVKLNKVMHFIGLLLMPFIVISMTECLNSIFIYNMTYLGFFANYMVLLVFYLFIFTLSGSYKLSYIITNSLVFGFGVAHCYIVEFRGTPFLPMDFLGIRTALNVANTYDYTPTYQIITASLLFIFITIISTKTKTPKISLKGKIVYRSICGIFSASLLFIFYFTSILTNLGVKPDFWNQSRGYKNYGFAFSFFCNTNYLYMSEPANYNSNEVGKYVKDKIKEKEVKVSEKTPNIICIMNESLSDLKVLGDFETNEDYMPFLHSLQENTVKGNLYVPVIGAGTSNTEFEFLTGHTTAFLPSGSNAYMLYVKNPLASLVSTLNAQGYVSSAFHPYYASGWNRVSVYNNMGFSKFKSLEDIMDISLMDDFISNGDTPDYLQNLLNMYSPDKKDMIIRQYVSDSYDYKEIINDYEAREKNTPYFMFNVTMQNHGGYTTSASNFNECISINSEEYYVKASKYLSLVKASDSAFEELINYFKNVKEPTIICMFGDHQPSIETDFVAKLLGVNSLSSISLEQEQSRHVTPFIIWANYDIEEKTIDKLSSNYLSSYVLDIAGVELTEYNKYLLSLSEKLPVIDTVGYIDNENNYFRWSDRSQYSEILSEYERIQYNGVFDTEHTDTSIFYLKGYTQSDIVKTDSEEAEKK